MKPISVVLVLLLSFAFALAQEEAVSDTMSAEDKTAMEVAALLEEAETLHDAEDYDKTMEILIKAKKLDPENDEILWKISRGYFDFADRKPDDFEYQKDFVYLGLEYAKKTLDSNPNSANGHKWYAIHIGRVGEIEGTKQKILNSYEVKEHTMKAIELDPEEAANYHVMGRWHYALSELSWFEAQVASLIYAKLPEASFEEAVEFFLKANELDPDDIRNMLYAGHCYVKLDKEDDAANWYRKALAVDATSDSDKALQTQAQEALDDL